MSDKISIRLIKYASILVLFAIPFSSFSQERPTRGKVVYEGTYSGREAEGFLFLMGSNIEGAITLTVDFDGAAVRANYRTTGKLRGGTVTGLVEGDSCRLVGSRNLSIEGECTGTSFVGTLISQPVPTRKTTVELRLALRTDGTETRRNPSQSGSTVPLTAPREATSTPNSIDFSQLPQGEDPLIRSIAEKIAQRRDTLPGSIKFDGIQKHPKRDDDTLLYKFSYKNVHSDSKKVEDNEKLFWVDNQNVFCESWGGSGVPLFRECEARYLVPVSRLPENCNQQTRMTGVQYCNSVEPVGTRFNAALPLLMVYPKSFGQTLIPGSMKLSNLRIDIRRPRFSLVDIEWESTLRNSPKRRSAGSILFKDDKLVCAYVFQSGDCIRPFTDSEAEARGRAFILEATPTGIELPKSVSSCLQDQEKHSSSSVQTSPGGCDMRNDGSLKNCEPATYEERGYTSQVVANVCQQVVSFDYVCGGEIEKRFKIAANSSAYADFKVSKLPPGCRLEKSR